jgi:hypothetical protein
MLEHSFLREDGKGEEEADAKVAVENRAMVVEE